VWIHGRFDGNAVMAEVLDQLEEFRLKVLCEALSRLIKKEANRCEAGRIKDRQHPF
jgi:hypothetical protein